MKNGPIQFVRKEEFKRHNRLIIAKNHLLGTDPSGYSIRPPKVTSVKRSGFELKSEENIIWAPSSESVSSSIPSWQISTAHAQPFRGARDLAFCLKVPLYSLLVWASSGGSGETARMPRLAWTFAARTGSKYQIRLTRPIYCGFYQNFTNCIIHCSPLFCSQCFRSTTSRNSFYLDDRWNLVKIL